MLGTTRYITLEAARRMMAAAQAEARRQDWKVAIAIVDAGGSLIAFEKLDDTQVASVDISIGKARTAARFKRPTKVLEDRIASGRTVFLALEGVVPIQGGVPVVADGAVIGAVGVSGVTSAEDEQVATAAVQAIQG